MKRQHEIDMIEDIASFGISKRKNTDEDSSEEQVKWYHTKNRAV
ncbi:MAG: hypothetical protein NTX32_05105 [Candidatus Firestonebacteria bacterium]|nr:hypothetical protein [Candidatus Firestonebacteria bacterium]